MVQALQKVGELADLYKSTRGPGMSEFLNEITLFNKVIGYGLRAFIHAAKKRMF